MVFEFDAEKSALNKEKHGIDFEEAQELWMDEKAIRFPSDRSDEERFLVIGKIKNKYWTAVMTWREGIIRIISVRKSRRKEILVYESE
ncbi:BrnT family toxin [Ekhidna sp.]|uniref:BrnT family toxin n=1 Tax=Ekhidna sp. TaxID=2608089 RepID=UPI0032EF8299